jgi:uncharacterized protein (DUF2236 family)
MTVAREDLEDFLERLRREIGDPRAGLFGPGSTMWEVNREAVAFLGGGRAALLQLAHPYVAHAVDQHSRTREDLLGRFVRTFDHVFAMVFGDLDGAIRSSRRVHAFHRTVTGTIDEDIGPFRKGHRYQANDEAALFWVEATLIDTSVQIFELLVRSLTLAEKEAFYRDWRRFGFLFGIPDRDVPPDWTAFERYMARMFRDGSPLAVGRPARALSGFLFHPKSLPVAAFARWYEVMTAALLPERIRSEFGFTHGVAQRATFQTSVAALRIALPHLPSAIRYLPAYNEALRRIGAHEASPFESIVFDAWQRLAASARPAAG